MLAGAAEKPSYPDLPQAGSMFSSGRSVASPHALTRWKQALEPESVFVASDDRRDLLRRVAHHRFTSRNDAVIWPGLQAQRHNVSALRRTDRFGQFAQHSEIMPGNSEQASVANHRQQQDQSSPVAGRRDANDNPSNE